MKAWARARKTLSPKSQKDVSKTIQVNQRSPLKNSVTPSITTRSRLSPTKSYCTISSNPKSTTLKAPWPQGTSPWRPMGNACVDAKRYRIFKIGNHLLLKKGTRRMVKEDCGTTVPKRRKIKSIWIFRWWTVMTVLPSHLLYLWRIAENDFNIL